MAFNERNHPQLGMFSMLVKEARRNDEISRTYPSTDLPEIFGPNSTPRLVEKLAFQGPNRIYVSKDGLVMHVLMWQGTEYDYEAYYHVFDFKNPQQAQEEPKIRSEWLITGSPVDIETEVLRFKRKHMLTGDLLLKPDAILESLHHEGEFIHLLGQEEVYCRYHVSPMRGIRVIDLGFGDFRTNPSENFRTIPTVPPETRQYAFPFVIMPTELALR